MLKYWLFLLFLGFSIPLKAQNLVSDPGFEMIRDTTFCFGGIDTSVANQTSIFFRFPKVLKYWHSPSYVLAGYVNFECRKTHPANGNVANDFGSKKPFEGDGIAQLFCFLGSIDANSDSTFDNRRAYIQTRLTNTLKKNTYYKVIFHASPTYHVRLSDDWNHYAISNLGAYLSNERPTRFNNPYSFNNSEKNTVIQVNPQIQNHSDSLLSDTSSWYKICGIFKAEGGEKWLTIGNFSTDSATNLQLIHSASASGRVIVSSMYYIDLVSVEEVTLFPNETISKDTVVCKGSLFTKTLRARPGASYYQWSTGDSSSSITVDSIGIYWLNADYGCGLETDTFRIVEQAALSLNLGADIEICEDADSVKITAPLGFNQYLWSTGDSLNEIRVKQSGIYTLMAVYLCDTLFDTITVSVKNKPLPPLVSDTGFCLNASVQLNANGQNLLWYDSLEDSSPKQTSPTYLNGQLGKKRFFVSQTINGCESDVASFIVLTEAPTNENLENDTILCSVDSLVIGSPYHQGWKYRWNTSDTTSFITVSNSGLYRLQVSNYCKSSIDSIRVDFNTTPQPPIVQDLTFCKTDIITIESLKVKGANLKWYASESANGSSNVPDFSFSSNVGQHDFYVSQTVGGCEGKKSHFTINIIQKPEVNIVSDTLLCDGEQLLLDVFSEKASYKWNTGATSSSILITTPGLFIVEVIHSCGVIKTESKVAFEVCETNVFMPNAFSPNGDGKNDTFFPEGKNFEIIYFQVFNRWGELIYNHPSPWDGKHNGQIVQTGTYVYYIEYKNFKGETQYLKDTFTILK